MTAILGISAFYHDSAAAIVVDGQIVAAAHEERFSRRKHDAAFPAAAVEYCLSAAGIRSEDLDYVAFYDKPLTKFERMLETYVAFAPRGFRSFAHGLPSWLKDKLFLRGNIRRSIPAAKKARLVFTDHHESHAASAFFPSPYNSAAILTLDGVGEWSTTTFGSGRGNKLQLTHHLQFPHSLGLLYSAFTYYCGFKVNSGEYKLMGLAPYGKPIYVDAILQHLVDLKPDGSMWMNMDLFNYCTGLTMTNDRFHRLFGGPPRSPESNLEQRHLDLAASIQKVTEEAVLRMANHVHKVTGEENLVLAGGVALNCVANGRLLREGPFRNIWIQPAAGDAGGALGAALFTWHQLLERPRTAQRPDGQQASLLGPSFSNEEIRTLLDQQTDADEQYSVEHHVTESELIDAVTTLLTSGKIVGWFHGRMEFGPRALGARSILGDPRSAKMQADMNLKIKFRESFRPFAPLVLAEHANEWFDMKPGEESPYMLLVAPVRPRHWTQLSDADARTMDTDPDLRHRVNIPRSTIPAVTHVDYSARIQTVDSGRHPRLHQLLTEFHRRTSCPVLVNTSFNVRGEPIVCRPEEALRSFLNTEMDALVLEDYLLIKDPAAFTLNEQSRSQYLAHFQLD